MSVKLYGSCPICGKRLCRALNGSDVDVVCPTCKKEVTVMVKNEIVSTVMTEDANGTKPTAN